MVKHQQWRKVDSKVKGKFRENSINQSCINQKSHNQTSGISFTVSSALLCCLSFPGMKKK
jgi:hypothetical protein